MTPIDCCSPCSAVPPVNIPGTPGSNAFTTTTANFVLPAANASVTVSVASTSWMVQGGFVVGISDTSGNFGTFQVLTINSPTSVTLKWLAMPYDSVTGTTISSPANVAATGLPGAAGGNAFSTLTMVGGFNVPAVNNQTTALTVNSNSWMQVGQNVFIAGPANFQVHSLAGTTGVVLTFLGYTGDVNPGINIPNGSQISPAGLQGASLAGYAILKVTTILSGTTFTPATNAKALFIECIGGGGSGGGGAAGGLGGSVGGGGGGGSYSYIYVTNATKTIQQTFAIQVGAGGSAPTAGANAGNAGETSDFYDNVALSVLCGSDGGFGGGAGAANGTGAAISLGGAGGVHVTNADASFDGGSGGAGILLSSGTVGVSGRGGDGPFGGGGLSLNAQGNGNPGLLYGAGGAGGCTLSSGAATAGGAGGQGMIRVWQLG